MKKKMPTRTKTIEKLCAVLFIVGLAIVQRTQAFHFDERGQPVYSNEAERIEYTRYVTDQGPFKGKSKRDLWAHKPPFSKYVGWPPRTPEAILMHQWWNAMEKADPDWGFKAEFPIVFYGRVMDESNAPIANAQANFEWSTGWGTKTKHMMADANGYFVFSNAIGGHLSVSVAKDGFYGRETSYGSFEIAQFFARDYYEPVATNPYTFILWHDVSDTSVREWDFWRYIPVDGSTNWISLGSGQYTNTGELAVSVLRSEPITNRGSAFVLRWIAEAGGGITTNVGDADYMYVAPTNGYVAELILSQAAKSSPTDRTFRGSVRHRMFAVTAKTNYAAIWTNVEQEHGPKARVSVRIKWNPNGSRIVH